MDKKSVWKKTSNKQFAEVLRKIKDDKTMQNFLRDVMTEKEIIEISSRLKAAYMLNKDISYEKVIKETNLSSRTVARISDWLKNGCGGYIKAIKIIDSHR